MQVLGCLIDAFEVVVLRMFCGFGVYGIFGVLRGSGMRRGAPG